MRVVYRFQETAIDLDVGSPERARQHEAVARKSPEFSTGNGNCRSGIPGFVHAASGDDRFDVVDSESHSRRRRLACEWKKGIPDQLLAMSRREGNGRRSGDAIRN